MVGPTGDNPPRQLALDLGALDELVLGYRVQVDDWKRP
jgi:hypothetical protein